MPECYNTIKIHDVIKLGNIKRLRFLIDSPPYKLHVTKPFGA